MRDKTAVLFGLLRFLVACCLGAHKGANLTGKAFQASSEGLLLAETRVEGGCEREEVSEEKVVDETA